MSDSASQLQWRESLIDSQMMWNDSIILSYIYTATGCPNVYNFHRHDLFDCFDSGYLLLPTATFLFCPTSCCYMSPQQDYMSQLQDLIHSRDHSSPSPIQLVQAHVQCSIADHNFYTLKLLLLAYLSEKIHKQKLF